MPKTFWQSVVFTFITATLMVLIMSSYNMLLRTNGQLWFVGWNNFLAELSCALPLALLIAGRYAPMLAHKLLGDKASRIAKSITITFCIAAIMVPTMSLFVLVRKVGIDNLSWPLYGKAIFSNFIVAFPIQVLFLGYLVRKLFRRSIGVKYKWRNYLTGMTPYLQNKGTIMATKAVLILNALTICVFSI